jgi:hypothetical protein
MKTLAVLSFTLLSATACAVDDDRDTSSTLQVIDACTLAPIGVKDVETGAYYFDDGSVYEADAVRPTALPDELCAYARMPHLYKKADGFVVAGSRCRGYADGAMLHEDCGGMVSALNAYLIIDSVAR